MSGRRLLLIEDDPDIAAVATLALEVAGDWEVWRCASGREALEVAPGLAPDVVLLDVMMPDMDGPTTLARLRETPELAETPVIFMTARARREETEHYLSLGAVGVIAKPFDPMSLGEEVRRLLRGRAGERD